MSWQKTKNVGHFYHSAAQIARWHNAKQNMANKGITYTEKFTQFTIFLKEDSFTLDWKVKNIPTHYYQDLL